MKRSMVLKYNLIEKLAKNPDYENIIIGTGTLARDMRRKLVLMGLKAPYLVGEKSDQANDILHYSKIAELGSPDLYRFIICCDTDEWALIGDALQVIYKFLGHAVHNHPQVVRFSITNTLMEQAGKRIIDTANCNVYLGDNKPYVVFGDEDDGGSFNIHILGSCHAGGVCPFSRESYPEILSRLLIEAGFRTTVYSWGQVSTPVSDCIVSFIRDVCFYRADLVILYLADRYSPLSIAARNTLSSKAGTLAIKHPFITQLENTYNAKVSDGIDHDVTLQEIYTVQQRVFTAFSRLYGFTFWNIVPPTSVIIPEEQAVKLRGLSSGFLTRQRERKDEYLSVSNKEITKDYTDTFANVDDIFSMFIDEAHLSSAGNRLIAQRCAADILDAFGTKREGL